MLSHWPIRNKLWLGTVMLFCSVSLLSFSGLRGIYSYRQLVRDISFRAAELPLAAKLAHAVEELRFSFRDSQNQRYFAQELDPLALREDFHLRLQTVKTVVRQYDEQLRVGSEDDSEIADVRAERETVERIERVLKRIDESHTDDDWYLNRVQVDTLAGMLDELHTLAGGLPTHLQQRMENLKVDVRTKYHTWIGLASVTTLLACVILVGLVRVFDRWVFRPLQVLIDESRRISLGDFDHRIRLETHDEMAELAKALNDMTGRFQEIFNDLESQVRQRTKEVVRSEKLASVGFLAAGVAHEINNPLASIAWSAEALESRLDDVIQTDDARPDGEENPEIAVLRRYLRQIQDEAFRCKGITERLLDFSRTGEVQKHDADLRQIVQDVIDLVRHLGKHRTKQIELRPGESVVAPVNAQEIKQVVLNLIVNALDSLDPHGRVTIDVRRAGREAELIVVDNGCGMTAEVREHLFEPFFTRRREGQGTGLGLSISYRIVHEHGGRIEARSDGPGRGSQFMVSLPLELREQRQREVRQVA